MSQKKVRKLMSNTLPEGNQRPQYPGVNVDGYPSDMDVYECRRLRLLELLREFSAVDLAARSGIAATTISRYKSDPAAKGHKRMSEDNARKLEAAGHKPHYWLDRQHWTPTQHASAGASSAGEPLAHYLSQPQNDDEPITCTWEFILSAVPLPPRFRLSMPDDALAPGTPRGTTLIFSTSAAPVFGHGVLVEAADGARHVRRYAQAPHGQWIAEARNSAYVSIASETGAKVLAVVIGRETGEV